MLKSNFEKNHRKLSCKFLSFNYKNYITLKKITENNFKHKK